MGHHTKLMIFAVSALGSCSLTYPGRLVPPHIAQFPRECDLFFFDGLPGKRRPRIQIV